MGINMTLNKVYTIEGNDEPAGLFVFKLFTKEKDAKAFIKRFKIAQFAEPKLDDITILKSNKDWKEYFIKVDEWQAKYPEAKWCGLFSSVEVGTMNIE